MQFYRHESCGQCTPCREGSRLARRASADKLLDGKASMEELDEPARHRQRHHGQHHLRVRRGHGDAGARFLQKFRKEFEAYVRGERKRADATLHRRRRWRLTDERPWATIYFYVCARSLRSAGAIAVVIATNPIRGAMGLLLLILSVAGLFLALHAAVPRGDSAHRLRGRHRRPLPLRHHAARPERRDARTTGAGCVARVFGGGLFAAGGRRRA